MPPFIQCSVNLWSLLQSLLLVQSVKCNIYCLQIWWEIAELGKWILSEFMENRISQYLNSIWHRKKKWHFKQQCYWQYEFDVLQQSKMKLDKNLDLNWPSLLLWVVDLFNALGKDLLLVKKVNQWFCYMNNTWLLVRTW